MLESPQALSLSGLKCFPVKFAKFLRATFFTKQFRWLLLVYVTLSLPWKSSYKFPAHILGQLHFVLLRKEYLYSEDIYYFISLSLLQLFFKITIHKSTLKELLLNRLS